MKKKKAAEPQSMKCSTCNQQVQLDEFEAHLAQHLKPQPAPEFAPAPQPTQTWQQPQQQGNNAAAVVIPPPEQPKFLNMQVLGEMGWKVESTVKAVRQGNGNFGPGFNLLLENGYTVTVKKDSQNHFDLYKAYGPNWISRKVLIQPGTTKKGTARIAVMPVV